MLYELFTFFSDQIGFFRVFHYPSFRIPAAALTALIATLWFFPNFIEKLRDLQRGDTKVREDTPERHQKTKHGTPTMGGLFLLLTVLGSTLLWADLHNAYVWAVLIVLVGYGAIGFVDDYAKIKKKNSRGLSGRRKLFWQTMVLFVVGGIFAVVQNNFVPATHLVFDTHLSLPFVSVRWFNPDLGFAYWPMAAFLIVGTSNAVNLTDGLDGLAIGPVIVSSATFCMLAYLAGLVLTFNSQGTWVDFNVAEYLNIPHIETISELAVPCAGICGAGLGFLWFNTFPATVFMGDVGSLALGGVLGTMAVLTKNELLSAILHGVFLMEALSVIFQVGSFKLTGRRVFRMAPIHHHFELKGWAEPKIIVRFWIVSIILALVSLTSLKLR